jgi:catechol 2,3-dioxygenase-like lactoylglutathione lyase family enzyme
MSTAAIHDTTKARREEVYDREGSFHPTTYVGKSPIKPNKLGHFVYEVSDVERTAKFWTEVMGFVETDRNKHGMVFFRCGKDHHGIGLKPMGKGKKPKRDIHGSLQVEHLAIEVDNTEILRQAKEFFIANNIPIVFEGRKGAGCNISINFLDPDGYEFEIYTDMDQIGPDGRLRPASMFKPRNPLEEAIEDPVEKKW